MSEVADTRVRPRLHDDEVTTLRAFLTYHRETLRHACSGLTREQLGQRLPPSTMNLGGLLKHLALVESQWFDHWFRDAGFAPPFDDLDWDDADWEFRTAVDHRPEELLHLFDEAVRRADDVVDQALAGDGLDTRSVLVSPHTGETFTLRWILVHMIGEYCRHNGHADLIRQSIDGRTGQ